MILLLSAMFAAVCVHFGPSRTSNSPHNKNKIQVDYLVETLAENAQVESHQTECGQIIRAIAVVTVNSVEHGRVILLSNNARNGFLLPCSF